MLRQRAYQVFDRIVRPLWTMINEHVLNISTVPSKREGRPNGTMFCDSQGYDSNDYFHIRKLLRSLNLTSSDVVYDLGCGMGRMLCLAAQYPVRRCIGIEIMPELCEIARFNALRLRKCRSVIEVICCDCAKADLARGTVYLMFNPFGDATMRAVLGNIHSSLQSDPRSVRFVYTNAVHENQLAACGWLHRTGGFRTGSGNQVSFWKSKPGAYCSPKDALVEEPVPQPAERRSSRGQTLLCGIADLLALGCT
jgi:SAM-dependent methyltransferase